MFGKKKHRMRNYSVIISGLLFLLSCAPQNSSPEKGFKFSGHTQGTTYTIIVAEDSIHFQQSEIDELLAAFDTILSTYIPESEISKLNASEASYAFKDTHSFFKNCYTISQEVYTNSNGLFDPSVYPLVKEWGFFDKSEHIPDQQVIDSILSFTGFEHTKHHSVLFDADSVKFTKKDPRFKLDFNGIAQGYSVDVIAGFIENRGHHNYYVEIGGELRVKGVNREGKKWLVGIDTPSEENEAHSIITTVSITDCGMATSGNYRNFFEKDGKKYGHTLHPATGKPIATDVLSATVVAENAALADAYATVFLILGKERGIQFLENNKNLKVLLIYVDSDDQLKIYTTIDQTEQPA